MEVEFEILSKLVFDNIYKETAKVSKQNVMQYLILSSWVLKMTRSKYYKGQIQVTLLFYVGQDSSGKGLR